MTFCVLSGGRPCIEKTVQFEQTVRQRRILPRLATPVIGLWSSRLMVQRYQEPTETWEQSSVKAGDVWSASKTGKSKRDQNESGLLAATLVRRLDARRAAARRLSSSPRACTAFSEKRDLRAAP